MNLRFYKYHGAGNDFVIIDNRQGTFDAKRKTVEFLCNRYFGIGADGLMLLENDNNYDFRMRYFNSDGRESTMCGNGGRCIAAFAKRLGIVKDKTVFTASDGEHTAEISGDLPELTVKLKMSDVNISTLKTNPDFLNTGSPHHIEFTGDIEKTDVNKTGAAIRYSPEYKAIGGTNVNFIQQEDSHTIAIRTYERGVENETLACGTGATASAIVAGIRNGLYKTTIKVKARGGTLEVSYEIIDNFARNVFLTGPAREVFHGVIEI